MLKGIAGGPVRWMIILRLFAFCFIRIGATITGFGGRISWGFSGGVILTELVRIANSKASSKTKI